MHHQMLYRTQEKTKTATLINKYSDLRKKPPPLQPLQNAFGPGEEKKTTTLLHIGDLPLTIFRYPHHSFPSLIQRNSASIIQLTSTHVVTAGIFIFIFIFLYYYKVVSPFYIHTRDQQRRHERLYRR